MPRYFFHVHDGTLELDDHGTMLPHLRAARLEAVRFLGELLRDDPEEFWQRSELRIEATGEDGVLLFTVTASAADAPDAAAILPPRRAPEPAIAAGQNLMVD